MSTLNTEQASSDPSSHHHQTIRVNNELVRIVDHTPTGQQVLAAANLRPEMEYALLLWPSTGPTREVGLEEVIALPEDGPPLEFLAIRADGISYFVLDDDRYAWVGPLDVEAIRRIGRVPSNRQIWLERRDEPDLLLQPGQAVDLSGSGVERLYTLVQMWRLDVQGEPTEWDRPEVGVREALVKAGIDLTKAWTIVLKVKGQEPRQVSLEDVIDLNTPGIERLWLRPRQVDNGDAPVFRREFALLPKDEAFLTAAGHHWETFTDGGRRWLIIDEYPLPKGYNLSVCRLALEIPQTYPAAQIDMFYCDPPLSLHSGAAPDRTTVRQAIAGVSFQRWSRHRNSNSQWSPARDNVSTHLGLVDEALGREVGA